MFRPCDKCGEPGVIDGCCYDHAKLCASCNEDPVHYNDVVCNKCYKALITENKKCFICKTAFVIELKKSAAGWYVSRCCKCDHHAKISGFYETKEQAVASI